MLTVMYITQTTDKITLLETVSELRAEKDDICYFLELENNISNQCIYLLNHYADGQLPLSEYPDICN